MTTFQLLTLPLLIAAIIFTAMAIARRRITPGVGVGWVLLWVAAAISIAAPGILAVVARFLGIGRGADLVMYLSILVMFIGFFVMYLRYRRLNDQLTEIVRHLAIRDAEERKR
jgi:small membrane protein